MIWNPPRRNSPSLSPLCSAQSGIVTKLHNNVSKIPMIAVQFTVTKDASFYSVKTQSATIPFYNEKPFVFGKPKTTKWLKGLKSVVFAVEHEHAYKKINKSQHVQHNLGWNPHQSVPNRDELAFLFPSGKTFCEICTYVMAEIWPVCQWEVQLDEKLFCKSHYASMDKVWTVFTSCLIELAMKRLVLSCLFNFSHTTWNHATMLESIVKAQKSKSSKSCGVWGGLSLDIWSAA